MAPDSRRTLQQTLDMASWRIAGGSLRRLVATVRAGKWPDGPRLTSQELSDLERALADIREAVAPDTNA